MIRVFLKHLPYPFKIKTAVGQQVHLPVLDPVLCQRTAGGSDSDDLLQRIVGLSRRGNENIPGTEIAHQCQSKGVCAAGDLRTDQGVLGAEIGGVDLLERVPADIVISIAGRPFEVGFTHMVFLHGADYPELAVIGGLINGVEASAEFSEYGGGKIQDFCGDAESGVLFGECVLHAGS